jgi:hypothetical protein
MIMDIFGLPDDVLNTIYLNKHSLEFYTTLEKINHIKPYIDYSKIKDDNYDNNRCFQYDTHLENDFESIKSHADTDYEINTNVSSISYTHTDDLHEHDGVSSDDEFKHFVNAGCLSNCFKLKDQLQYLTNNRAIYIDMTRDSEYWFDEHYFELPRKYGNDWIWKHFEKQLNIQVVKNNSLEAKYHIGIKDIIKFGLYGKDLYQY